MCYKRCVLRFSYRNKYTRFFLRCNNDTWCQQCQIWKGVNGLFLEHSVDQLQLANAIVCVLCVNCDWNNQRIFFKLTFKSFNDSHYSGVQKIRKYGFWGMWWSMSKLKMYLGVLKHKYCKFSFMARVQV